jgi:hypothetical protein
LLEQRGINEAAEYMMIEGFGAIGQPPIGTGIICKSVSPGTTET